MRKDFLNPMVLLSVDFCLLHCTVQLLCKQRSRPRAKHHIDTAYPGLVRIYYNYIHKSAGMHRIIIPR